MSVLCVNCYVTKNSRAIDLIIQNWLKLRQCTRNALLYRFGYLNLYSQIHGWFMSMYDKTHYNIVK